MQTMVQHLEYLEEAAEEGEEVEEEEEEEVVEEEAEEEEVEEDETIAFVVTCLKIPFILIFFLNKINFFKM